MNLKSAELFPTTTWTGINIENKQGSRSFSEPGNPIKLYNYVEDYIKNIHVAPAATFEYEMNSEDTALPSRIKMVWYADGELYSRKYIFPEDAVLYKKFEVIPESSEYHDKIAFDISSQETPFEFGSVAGPN